MWDDDSFDYGIDESDLYGADTCDGSVWDDDDDDDTAVAGCGIGDSSSPVR